MDLTTFVAPIITLSMGAAIFFAAFSKLQGQFEIAMKDLRADISEVKEISKETSANTIRNEEQIKSLSDDVRKHNGLVERTYKLESDMKTAFMRHDEVKERLNRLEEKQ